MPPGGSTSTESDGLESAGSKVRNELSCPVIFQFSTQMAKDSFKTPLKLEKPLTMSIYSLFNIHPQESVSYFQLVDSVTQHFITQFVNAMPDRAQVYMTDKNESTLVHHLSCLRDFDDKEFVILFFPMSQKVAYGEMDSFYKLLGTLVKTYYEQQRKLLNTFLEKVPSDIKLKTQRLLKEMNSANFSIYEKIVVIEYVNLMLTAQTPAVFDNYLKQFRHYGYQVQGTPIRGYQIVSEVMFALATGLSIAAIAGTLGFGLALGVGITSLYTSSVCFFSYGCQKGVSKGMCDLSYALPSTQSPFLRLKSMFPKVHWVKTDESSARAMFGEQVDALDFLQQIKKHAEKLKIEIFDDCTGESVPTITLSRLSNDKLIALASALEHDNSIACTSP